MVVGTNLLDQIHAVTSLNIAREHRVAGPFPEAVTRDAPCLRREQAQNRTADPPGHVAFVRVLDQHAPHAPPARSGIAIGPPWPKVRMAIAGTRIHPRMSPTEADKVIVDG